MAGSSCSPARPGPAPRAKWQRRSRAPARACGDEGSRSVLPDERHAKARCRNEIEEERADVPPRFHEAVRETRELGLLATDGGAAEREAEPLTRRALMDDCARGKDVRQLDGTIERPVDVGPHDRSARVDGDPVIGILEVPGRVVILEAEAKTIERRVAGLASRGAGSRLEQHTIRLRARIGGSHGLREIDPGWWRDRKAAKEPKLDAVAAHRR